MSEKQCLPENLLHRVLVIEDNPITTTLLETSLERRGYDVSTAADPQVALALSTSQSFDLVITDYSLTPITGLELALQLLRSGQSPAFLFISGANDEIRHMVLSSIPDARFLNKPFTIEGLLLSLIKLAEIATKKKAL